MQKFKFVIVPLVLSAFSPFASKAQVYKSSDSSTIHSLTARPQKPKPLTRENSFGFRMNSDGWSVVYEAGKSVSEDLKRIERFYDVRVFQIELSERHHPKEVRMYGWDIDHQSNKQYVFGKINNFYALKGNFLFRKMIAGKPIDGNVSLHMVYGGGLSIGLIKPYYVNAYVSEDGGQSFTKKDVGLTPATSPYFLNPVYVIGASSWGAGLGGIKVVPGLHTKLGAHFDFARQTRLVSAAEVGVTAELYSKKIEIMADQKATAYFFNLYAGIQFGKRHQ